MDDQEPAMEVGDIEIARQPYTLRMLAEAPVERSRVGRRCVESAVSPSGRLSTADVNWPPRSLAILVFDGHRAVSRQIARVIDRVDARPSEGRQCAKWPSISFKYGLRNGNGEVFGIERVERLQVVGADKQGFLPLFIPRNIVGRSGLSGRANRSLGHIRTFVVASASMSCSINLRATLAPTTCAKATGTAFPSWRMDSVQLP